jgi:hypothetical protein
LSELSVPSRSLPKRWSTHKAIRFLRFHLPQGFAFSLLLVYAIVAVLAYLSTLQPGHLGLRVGLSGDAAHVTWVMPAGKAWDQGARPGMVVLSVNGQALAGLNEDALTTEAASEAVLQKSNGEELSLKVTPRPLGQSPMKFSLLALGAVFALLGAAVVLRRPDLRAAKVFGIFAGFTSIALAIAPDSGGAGHEWALVTQFITEAAASASLLYFVVALAGESLWSRPSFVWPARLFVGFGCILAAGEQCRSLPDPPGTSG